MVFFANPDVNLRFSLCGCDPEVAATQAPDLLYTG